MQLQTIQSVSQRQSLVVTAQLQQAICMLQMSNADLRSFLETEAAENPFFEAELAAQVQERKRQEVAPALPMSRGGAEGDFDFIQMRAEERQKSLYAHVSAQFDMMFDLPAERIAAEVFLEALEPSGWLGDRLEVIAARAGLDIYAAEEMLNRVQRVEPAGLFARSLAECLELQAADRGFLTPLFERLLENLSLLARADLKALCRACECDMEALRPQLRLLRCLDPKPGAGFDAEEPAERAPDLIVTGRPGAWGVELNNSTLPTVIVDERAAEMFGADRAAAPYVAERLSSARWFRRAVEHRNQTTLKVGAEIVRRQAEFLEYGPARIRPMILRDVAAAVGVHESTVSRVTTGLMIATPQGTFPLKTFFSAALAGAEEGDEAQSAAAVRHRIQNLIREERPGAPLSDDEIARIVSGDGIRLARRTVAKYREGLGIPSSFQRRRAARLAAG
ncbi:RNA polymerase RpoN-/SigL-like sigma 54 subunit [Rhodovulum bhavnagarense]|uniref:RNA polymerase sigma-54 factor n=1 Tax=Rhodovulum bhavnagarense TaxID=992286 RepID=A0A4V2SWA8_9RHOB|nr:RNA polymerase factor sigma-54 [Rhodovulum bhavnagarense]TCP61396.1 RNA polymerase RpoN-/SigL-like sigma 54 subunit [Rhodovulum bhavnagarense]